jgi:hypothetical protein
MWLTGRLAPHFKTIANFRKDTGSAIRKVCRQFIVLCRQLMSAEPIYEEGPTAREDRGLEGADLVSSYSASAAGSTTSRSIYGTIAKGLWTVTYPAANIWSGRVDAVIS